MSKDLGELSDGELRERYAGVSRDVEAGGAAVLESLVVELLRREPGAEGLWYDRGMFAKWRRDWPASLAHNLRSFELLPPEARAGDPTCWNLGIAATAQRDWAAARQAWAGFGIELPGTSGPVAGDFGAAPVRLNAHPRFAGHEPLVIDGETHEIEVVWGRRLCPARIEILDAPTPDSGHRRGDVVPHDGDPVGTRRLGDGEVGVFNEIELWERSPVPTLTALVRAPNEKAVEELSDLFDEAGGAAEDWTATLNLLCRACSEGTAEHDHAPAGGWSAERTVGVSAEPERARAVLDRWSKGPFNRRSYRDLTLVLA